MTKFLLSGAAAAAIVAIAPATAQPAPPTPPGVAQGTAPQVQTMRMPMRAQTRDGVVRHVREMFARLDTNRDGFVTRQESDAAKQGMAGDRRVRLAQRLANRGPRDRGAAFDRLDTNKDGMISRQEFLAAKPQVQTRVFTMRHGEGPVEVGGAPGQPRVRGMRMHGMGMRGRMFETADANRDGRVTLQEMTNAALQHFDKADTNHDGRISPEERMQRRQRVRVQRLQS
jgi:Ca2+-binding EF-hand superfamily protein